MKYILVTFLFIITNSYGQSDEQTGKKNSSSDSTVIAGKLYMQLHLADSIFVEVNKTKDELKTVSHFIKSDSYLEINYTFKEDDLYAAHVKERRRTLNMALYSDYYYSKNKIIGEQHSESVPQGLALPNDATSNEYRSYNKTFTAAFKRKYMEELLSSIKAQSLNAWKIK
ncbi:MAG TPA: hypothetical protein PLL00_15035 [Bacteroidia bacterium]|jgi:hypothetical protein|nr:hypothetical protein [Bacteroidia bacterium]